MTSGIYDWTGIEYRDLKKDEIQLTISRHSTEGLAAHLRKNLVDLGEWEGRAIGPVPANIAQKIRDNMAGVAIQLGWSGGTNDDGHRRAAYSSKVIKNGEDNCYVYIVRRSEKPIPNAVALQ